MGGQYPRALWEQTGKLEYLMNLAGGAGADGSRLRWPLWVKPGKAQNEQILSAFPRIADVHARCRNGREVPGEDMAAQGSGPITPYASVSPNGLGLA